MTQIVQPKEHLASKTQRWVAKYSDANDSTLSLKRQRRFAKYERELLRCGKELQALSRFTSAQIIAFRKILKKYKVCNNEAFQSRVSSSLLFFFSSFFVVTGGRAALPGLASLFILLS